MPVKMQYDRAKLVAFCRKWRIKRLSFFGSVVRDDFSAESDVDVLYVFEDGKTPGWDITTCEEELSEILGRKVDFVPEHGVNRWIRARVLREAEVQYEG
ncbi:MAG TPA: nucleotidyltransferase domain-containing protein [Tepidisphaeraceae bacterium]|nr:nucleotidyltransferase domain-containing protein [Tepidisphaeraceae bacterium]